MKKIFAYILSDVLTLGTCMTAFAAPSTETPAEISIRKDGKSHSVYVFGTALALVFEDVNIEISNIKPVGRVDVMIDGVVTKNLASVDIPAGQRTKMALDSSQPEYP